MPERARLVVLTGRRHPHEILVLAVSLLQGVAFVAGATPPSSVAGLGPGWLAPVWYLLLLASGAIGLAGNLWRGHLVLALRLRLSGMLLAAAPAAVYAVAVFAAFGGRALYGAGVVAAFAAAGVWRAAQLAADLRELDRWAAQ